MKRKSHFHFISQFWRLAFVSISWLAFSCEENRRSVESSRSNELVADLTILATLIREESDSTLFECHSYSELINQISGKEDLDAIKHDREFDFYPLSKTARGAGSESIFIATKHPVKVSGGNTYYVVLRHNLDVEEIPEEVLRTQIKQQTN